MGFLSSFCPHLAAESISMIIELHGEELAMIPTGYTQLPSEQPQDDQREGQENYGRACDAARKKHIHEHRVRVGLKFDSIVATNLPCRKV